MRFVRPLALAGLAGAALLTASPAGALGVSPTCPSGSQGVVVTHNGSSTYVCTTLVGDVQRIIAQLVDIDCNCSIDLPPRR